ncbi:MAG: hypothetical protein ACR2PA_02115 [Hyphomicrobiaceae bacterium]
MVAVGLSGWLYFGFAEGDREMAIPVEDPSEGLRKTPSRESEALWRANGEASRLARLLEEKRKELEQQQSDITQIKTILAAEKKKRQLAEAKTVMPSQTKSTALETAALTAEKLKSANQLVRALQDKLNQASNSVQTVRRKNVELEKALVDMRNKFETSVGKTSRKPPFASPAFAEVTEQLKDERASARTAEAALAATAEKLAEMRSEAKRLSQKVQWLKAELNESYSNTRMKFSELQLHDAEVAALSHAKSSLKPVLKSTKGPDRKPKTIVKRRHIAASNTASSLSTRPKGPEKRQAKNKQEEHANSSAPKELASACARRGWLTTLKMGGWSRSSKLATIRRLCAHAPNSAEPAKCFDKLMTGQVNWGAGNKWSTANALRLCSGTISASRTIACFRSSLANMGWRDAISKCT